MNKVQFTAANKIAFSNANKLLFGCIDCQNCDPTYGVPDQIEAVISGLANKSPPNCEECGSLNGTWVLSKVSDSRGYCRWSYTFPSSICGFAAITLVIDDGFYTGITPYCVFVFFSAFAFFKKQHASKPNCQFGGESLDDGTVIGNCDVVAATCILTAL